MVDSFRQAINDNSGNLERESPLTDQTATSNTIYTSTKHWSTPKIGNSKELDPDLGGFSADCEELQVRFDAKGRILWCMMDQRDRPSFSPQILREFDLLQQRLHRLFEDLDLPRESLPRYVVLGSNTKAAFNFGGDLRLIAQLSREKDRARLQRYARACIDTLFPFIVGFELPLVTITLIQGDALGGGFEAALSGNIIVAERSVKFGLPEVLFNLFPGMGAYSLLARRIGPIQAEKLIMSGKVYTADEMHERGIVDVVAEPGAGQKAVYDFVGKNARRFNSHFGIFKTRERVWQVTYSELCDVANIWAEAALSLSDVDLKRIDRLADSQDRRLKSTR